MTNATYLHYGLNNIYNYLILQSSQAQNFFLSCLEGTKTEKF